MSSVILFFLKNYELLAWSVEVKPVTEYEYISTSENDVFTAYKKKNEKKFKRQRESEFIKKSQPE
jgi:hypothetical protein